MRPHLLVLTFALAMSVCGVQRAQAQGAVVSGSVAAVTSEQLTSAAYGGSVTYRFNQALGIGVELTQLRALRDPRFVAYCCAPDDGRATVFTTNIRLEVPTTSNRIIPFVTAGGGMAAVSHSYGVVYAATGLLFPTFALDVSNILPGPSELSYTTTNMALTLGGGASVALTKHVTLDIDLRALHLAGESTRTIGRFGTGVSYRF